MNDRSIATPEQPNSTPQNGSDVCAITIGVSSCLLGHHVRYDGEHKYHPFVATRLCREFHCLPICPEYAIGLGVPRDPIKLVQLANSIHALGVNDSSRDVTAPLQAYADFVQQQFPTLYGYVFKSRSPSCGLNSAPLLTLDGNAIGLDMGIYAQRLLDHFPGMPVVEETTLNDEAHLEQFIQLVKLYANAATNQ